MFCFVSIEKMRWVFNEGTNMKPLFVVLLRLYSRLSLLRSLWPVDLGKQIDPL
jgi:hypothetical protein